MLQGYCLNYNLERHSCFIENIDIMGDLVDDVVYRETREDIQNVKFLITSPIANPGKTAEIIARQRQQQRALFGQSQTSLAMPSFAFARFVGIFLKHNLASTKSDSPPRSECHFLRLFALNKYIFATFSWYI